MSVSTISQIRDSAVGVEVDVPGFTPDNTLTFKLKRPSLLEMSANGKIPNPLMATAAKLFKDGAVKTINDTKEDGSNFKGLSETMHCIVKEALVEPTYEDLQNNGIELTDVQMLYIYNYVVDGVNQLRGFRTK